MAKRKYVAPMHIETRRIPLFIDWIKKQGGEILPANSSLEWVRWKGKQKGVLYHTGSFSNDRAFRTFKEFLANIKWTDSPSSTPRQRGYFKQKEQILERDGDRCFFCGEKLGNDITIEHLISLSSGGIDRISNMVLAHKKCNQLAGNMTVVEKVLLRDKMYFYEK